MVDKKLGGAGLRGQSAGETALCTVGKEGAGLTYRGYTIEDLAANARFEEVAYMLLYGELPKADVLTDYEARLTGLRALPDALKSVLESIPKDTHPMDVMRTGCSMLGNLEPESNFAEQHQAAIFIQPTQETRWILRRMNGKNSGRNFMRARVLEFGRVILMICSMIEKLMPSQASL